MFEIRLDFSVFDADDPPCLRRDIVIVGDQNHGSSQDAVMTENQVERQESRFLR